LNIIRLMGREHASRSADRVHVWRAICGDCQWSGALVFRGHAAFASGKGFHDEAAAEAEGIAWAQAYAVRVLYIQLGAH
jgi:hypothetical protein